MLSTWNGENINRLGPSQRGGGKSFKAKALGDPGQGSSENPPPPAGKSVLQQQRKLKPLGSYSENAPPSAAKGKGKAGGGGLGQPPTSTSKPQQKQRRALGDISNAGKLSAGAGAGSGGAAGNAPSKLSGKQPTPGLSFTVHSDSGTASGGTRPRGSGSRASGSAKVGSAGRLDEHVDVDDVEMVLGRTGDEEEALVERKAEQRAAAAAAAAASALKYATRSRAPSRSRSRSQSTSAALAKPSAPPNNSSSKARFGRDITNTAAGAAGPGAAALDRSLDSAIDRMCLNDFEDGKMGLASGGKEESASTLLEDGCDLDMGMDMDMNSLAMALDGQTLDATPDGLVDDDGFLTQEMDLCLSFV